MTIWTPSGEHEVPRNSPGSGGAPPAAGQAQAQPPPPGGTSMAGPDGQPSEIDPQAQAEYEARLAEVRQQILATPIEAMVAQHFVGLFEVGAIHLSVENPDLGAARVAIDSMEAILSVLSKAEGVQDEVVESMDSMLGQIRMAFVQVSQGGTPASEN